MDTHDFEVMRWKALARALNVEHEYDMAFADQYLEKAGEEIAADFERLLATEDLRRHRVERVDRFGNRVGVKPVAEREGEPVTPINDILLRALLDPSEVPDGE